MIRFIITGLTHRYLAFIFRFYIAGIFIYAAIYKISYPAEFAETIVSYQIVPYWGVNILAVALPWLELICGILLAAGFRIRSVVAIIGFLLFVFTLGIFINLLRGSSISCGCFNATGEVISWWTFTRDIVWMVMTAHIFFYDGTLYKEKKFPFVFKNI